MIYYPSSDVYLLLELTTQCVFPTVWDLATSTLQYFISNSNKRKKGFVTQESVFAYLNKEQDSLGCILAELEQLLCLLLAVHIAELA